MTGEEVTPGLPEKLWLWSSFWKASKNAFVGRNP